MESNSTLSAWFATAIVTCLLPHAGAAATLIDVGTLNGHDSANAFSISGNGQVTGRSFSSGSPSSPRCFRTLANTALNETSDPAANVHSFLNYYFGGNVTSSTGYDIEQSISGGIEIAGEAAVNSTPRAFWYSEIGASRTARLLSLAYQGTSSSAAALKTGPYGSVVVGHCMVNGLAQACHWSISSSGSEWLYNYGNAYFSGKNSWATDTDINRTIGYYEYNFRYLPFIVDGQTGPKWDLPVGGGGDSAVPYGMHTSGTTTRIVGYTYEFLQKRATLWTYTGNGNVSQVLLDKFGYEHATALAINDAGQIVGSVWNSSPYVEKACFWRVTGGGGVLDDGSFDMNLIRAYKVGPSSTSSKVAGTGVNKSTGLSRGFILDHAD